MTKPLKMPESWLCVDCGRDTAPGVVNREQMEFIRRSSRGLPKWTRRQVLLPGPRTGNNTCEIYTVRGTVWKAAGMERMGGCLCIGCLEARLGRTLTWQDFPDHVLNTWPGTERLMDRRRRTFAVGGAR
jgi:hypothetical protein